MSPTKTYAHFLTTTQYFKLDAACIPLWKAFITRGFGVFLVGSALHKPDWRDVDIRVILPDDEYDRMFPDADEHGQTAFWHITCISISSYLSSVTGLPIDFQIQKQSEANAKYPTSEGHRRSAIGMFVHSYDDNRMGTKA